MDGRGRAQRTRERRLSATTAGLALLLAALLAYVYLVEVRGGARQERARAVQERLLPFSAGAATELALERPRPDPGTGPRLRLPARRIVCRKENGRWRIVAPVSAEGDETTITRVLEDVGAARVQRSLAGQPRDPAAFGLDRPITLTVASGGRRETVAVGKQNPTGDSVFARRALGAAAGPVLLVERRLRDAAEKTLYDLREKTILGFSPEEVTGITFTDRGRSVRLVRRPAGGTRAAGPGEMQAGWKLVAPLRAPADRTEVERSLNLLSYLRAEQFVSETPERLGRYGLAPPAGRARFDLKSGRSETLLFGRQTTYGALTRYYARQPGRGPIFTINDNLPREAQRPAAEWRERHAADFVRADVAELRLITPNRTVVCARVEGANGDEWRLAEFLGPVAEGMNLGAAARTPTALRADRDRVGDLLAHLGTLDAVAFLDGAAPTRPQFGLVKPGLKIVAMDKAGKSVATVAIGARAGDRCYATSPHLGGVFLVRAADVERFRGGGRELQARS